MWIKIEKDKYNCSPTFKVGTLLRMKCGKILFVGDVNTISGCCDCCRENDVEYFDETHVLLIQKIKENAENTLTF